MTQTELALPDLPDPNPNNGTVLPAGRPASLIQWAEGAKAAHGIAQSIARTPFVPRSLRADRRDFLIPDGLERDENNRRQAWKNASQEEKDWAAGQAEELTVGNVTAAILTGWELDLMPMASMRSIDLIDGVPGMRAHMMRALVLSHGHNLVVRESTDIRCVYAGQRRLGPNTWGEWQVVEWDIPRATALGLTGRREWKRQPKTMLWARATGELCRMIASDALHGVQYVTEELGGDLPDTPTLPPPPVAPSTSPAEVLDRRKAAKRPQTLTTTDTPMTDTPPADIEPVRVTVGGLEHEVYLIVGGTGPDDARVLLYGWRCDQCHIVHEPRHDTPQDAGADHQAYAEEAARVAAEDAQPEDFKPHPIPRPNRRDDEE